MSEHNYSGSCHCGAIGFKYHCRIAPQDWPLRACQCRFCRAHDAISTSQTNARLSFEASDPNRLARYRFGLMTADFLLCQNCGIYLGAVIATPSGKFGIINTRALTPEPDDMAVPAPISYDGEVADQRVTRREERWTPVTDVPW